MADAACTVRNQDGSEGRLGKTGTQDQSRSVVMCRIRSSLFKLNAHGMEFNHDDIVTPLLKSAH